MAEYSKRAMTEEEDKYSFRQSSQISNQCGLIGHLRADFGSDGSGFFTSWTDFRADLKTDEFALEFDEMINSLREDGDILHSRTDLAVYCSETPQSKMRLTDNSFGVRVDTERYTYLLRLNPNKGEYNLYCYCYRRDWLDQHIRQARKGIRFITPHYKELFRIPDGDKIRIVLPGGEKHDRTVRYIDEYHAEIDDNLYHICEFAERMEAAGAKVIPLRSALPEHCYVYIETENRIGIVTKGESGYQPVTDKECFDKDTNRQTVDECNRLWSITKAQAEAMKAGSMFGWHVPAADPKNYDADGRLIKPKSRDTDRER